MDGVEEEGGDGGGGGEEGGGREGIVVLEDKYKELCNDLNVDVQARQDAWDEFLQINTNVTLEGDSLHWLACSLYISCRKLAVMKEQLSIAIQGVSLGELLVRVKLSLLQFFQKVRKWLDMGKHGTIMNEKIEQMERIFSVSSIVFEQYSSIFKVIYKEEWCEEIRRGRRKQLMGTKDMFNFCWTLFICTKAQYPDISDDLVNSYHLMLCCLDLMFTNTLCVKQLKAAIRPEFKGVPENYLNSDLTSVDIPSIIDVLCQIHEGLPIETKIIRQQHLETYIEDLLRNGHLKGNVEKKTGLFDIMNYETNMKYLSESYYEQTIENYSIDEKVFIKEDATTHIGSPSRRVTAFSEVDDCKETTAASMDLSITLAVSRLQELVKGLKASPSDKLTALFQSLKEDPTDKVASSMEKFRATFLDQYTVSSPQHLEQPRKHISEARLHLAVVLFYKMLESFLDSELNQKKTTSDMSALVAQEMFQKCLFTCCVEIVLFSYKQVSKQFPWILKAFRLKPYHFFKIIELVIRTEDLSRDVIKHLSRVEEQILESLTWKSLSPIFISIETNGVPRCQEVASETSFSTPLLFMSPTTVRMSKDGFYNSPVMTMRGKLAAPLPSSPARRNLFGSAPKAEAPIPSSNSKLTTAVILPPKTSSNSSNQFPIMLTSPGKSPIRLYPVNAHNNSQQHQQNTAPQTNAAGIIRLTASPGKSAGVKKFGSLGIFFRKLYHMASVRLKDLCENLQIGTELQKKIWTCFEHSLTENIELVRDRHIDQLIMCAIYVICKVSKEEKSFHEIMKWYRTQPQAKSDVYRHVLIKRTKEGKCSPLKDTKTANSDSPEKYDKSKEETSQEGNEETKESSCETEEKYVYNDLIQFYNIVYIKKIKEFALKFAANKAQTEPLSPLPVTRKQVHSPRKLSKQHQIYISPIRSAPNVTPKSKMLFCFDSDSPKKLGEINAMIKGGTRRRVNFDEEGSLGATPSKRPLLNGITRRAEELRHEQMDMNRALSTSHF